MGEQMTLRLGLASRRVAKDAIQQGSDPTRSDPAKNAAGCGRGGAGEAMGSRLLKQVRARARTHPQSLRRCIDGPSCKMQVASARQARALRADAADPKPMPSLPRREGRKHLAAGTRARPHRSRRAHNAVSASPGSGGVIGRAGRRSR